MLIHKTPIELQALVVRLTALPVEGNNLVEVLRREWDRQKSLKSMHNNINQDTTPISTNQSVHNTTNPTTLINDYWGLRLGLIRG